MQPALQQSPAVRAHVAVTTAARYPGASSAGEASNALPNYLLPSGSADPRPLRRPLALGRFGPVGLDPHDRNLLAIGIQEVADRKSSLISLSACSSVGTARGPGGKVRKSSCTAHDAA